MHEKRRTMSKSTLRAEEARRQAQAALLEAKQQQNQMLEERATFFASETRKVFDLRAQRLATMASGKDAAPVRTVRRKAS
jgi:hypothetical protein